jgi:integrase
LSKLTDRKIKAFQAKDKLYRVADGHGLVIEITPAGGKHWRYRYRHLNKPDMLTIGSYPALSLSDARKEHEKWWAILQTGKDPKRVQKTEKQREANQGANTFQKFALDWLELKRPTLNKKYHTQLLARMNQHIFPVIGHLPIHEITIPEIVTVIESIAKRGTVETARRMNQMISQVFRYASRKGACVHNPAANIRDTLPYKEKKHHPCIPVAELPELLKNIENFRGEDVTKYALFLLMLTFVRTREIIEARWDEIDWERQEWHIPKERMKMRRPHMVPLSDYALDILKKLHAMTGDKEYIFYSSRSKSKHLSNGAFLRGLYRMGYKNRMCGHGFRTLASTILNETGHRPDVIERQLAHADKNAIRAAYNQAEYEMERKSMMQGYAKFIKNIESGKTDNNILNMPLQHCAD